MCPAGVVAVSSAGKKPPFANVYWFPLAAAYAALILPWSVAGQFGWLAAPPGLRIAWGHGHEMLFGFALAVVAGYVLGPLPKRQILSFVVLWVLARVTFLLWPGSGLAALCNVAFVLVLLWRIVPIFLKTAKKWRNRSVAFIVMGLALAMAAFHWQVQANPAQLSRLLFLDTILLFSTLMFFMGGRLLAPAIAGHLKQQGRTLKDKVQPRLEGAVLLLLALSLCSNLPMLPWTSGVMAAALVACALLTLVRLLRWRFWHCLDRADLLALLLGYSWLIAGWLLVAWSLVARQSALTLAFHAITVGALGTLTLTVMARTRLHRVLKDPNAIPAFYLLVLLISVAALLRLSLPWFSFRQALWLAMGCWSLAYVGLLILLLTLGWREKRPRPAKA